jgi:hypothetical protein
MTAPCPGIHANNAEAIPAEAVLHWYALQLPELNVWQQSDPGCFCVNAPVGPKQTVGADIT